MLGVFLFSPWSTFLGRTQVSPVRLRVPATRWSPESSANLPIRGNDRCIEFASVDAVCHVAGSLGCCCVCVVGAAPRQRLFEYAFL